MNSHRHVLSFHNATRALLLVSCLALLSGCAVFHSNRSASSARVQTLDTSLCALKEEFNRDTSRPRLLALFSPTCGGCVYGAKSLQREAKAAAKLGHRSEVMVVWLPMLDTDNEREARQSAKKFHLAGARHFYDGDRQSGARLMAEQFPNAVRELLEVLPHDHRLRESLEVRRNLAPEKMPLWDALLIFPPGATWTERTPAPVWWTRQVGFTGERGAGEPTSLFLKKNTRQPPVKSDWHLEAREALRLVQSATRELQQP